MILICFQLQSVEECIVPLILSVPKDPSRSPMPRDEFIERRLMYALLLCVVEGDGVTGVVGALPCLAFPCPRYVSALACSGCGGQ